MKIDEKLLEDDIDLFLKTAAKAFCTKGRDLLVNATKSAIANFYNALVFINIPPNEPVFYDRTYDFRDNSFIPVLKNNGARMYGGVKISTEKMQDYKNDDKMTVLQLSMHGFHGDPSLNIVSNSPIEILRKYYNSKKFRNEIDKYTEKEVKKQKYNYIHLLF